MEIRVMLYVEVAVRVEDCPVGEIGGQEARRGL